MKITKEYCDICKKEIFDEEGGEITIAGMFKIFIKMDLCKSCRIDCIDVIENLIPEEKP